MYGGREGSAAKLAVYNVAYVAAYYNQVATGVVLVELILNLKVLLVHHYLF